MKRGAISVDLRLSSKSDIEVKAFADVTVPLGDDGTITMLGFSALERDSRPARVMAPVRKGKRGWFNTVKLNGRVRNIVGAAVVAEYERRKSKLE